jgi:hypothetical protein
MGILKIYPSLWTRYFFQFYIPLGMHLIRYIDFEKICRINNIPWHIPFQMRVYMGKWYTCTTLIWTWQHSFTIVQWTTWRYIFNMDFAIGHYWFCNLVKWIWVLIKPIWQINKMTTWTLQVGKMHYKNSWLFKLFDLINMSVLIKILANSTQHP